jgi:diaminopimelate decarboxylase
VGKTVGVKAHDFYVKADEIRATDPLKAESFMSEGMRQTTKQWDNQVAPRMDTIKAQIENFNQELKAINHQFRVEPTIPTRLQEAIDIMKLTEKFGVSPATVESLVLKKTGLTVNTVSTQVGEFLEAMQRLRPGWF